MSAKTCPQVMWRSFGYRQESYACDRPIKRNGLCGIHAAAKERVAKNDQRRVDAKNAGEVLVARLARHGVTAYVAYDGSVRLVSSPAVLADLLDEVTQ